MALVFVLWIVVLLSAVAFEMSFKGHLRAQISAATGDTTKAFFLARAGVEKAIADLASMDSTLQAQYEMREDGALLYRNIELGVGTFTLYAGKDADGAHVYGMQDEASKLNINVVEAMLLENLPGLDAEIAASIAEQKQFQPFHDLEDLLLVEGIDRAMLFGEDQNGNGILDPSEDDGDRSWPQDNADGTLDGGLAQYLTTWSASRELTKDGEDRIDIRTASAENISDSIDEISLQQAQSIVAHREKNEFSSILDLYDVELVEQINQGGQGPEGTQPQGQVLGGRNGNPQGNVRMVVTPQNGAPQNQGNQPGQGQSGRPQGGINPENPEGQNDGEQPTTRSTGRMAFEEDAVRRIADLLTIQEGDVTQGLVNINTASVEVLACLPGIDEAIALAIVGEQLGRDGGFTTVMDLLTVDGISKDILKPIYARLAVRSDVFRVNSFGVLASGATHVSVSAIVDRTGYNAKILYWQEHE